MRKAVPLIVLRFRDIDVRKDETVKRHRQIIARHDFCWWGWLARPHERNPHRELTALHKRSERVASPYVVALYDTGRGLIYRAECSEIHATLDREKSPSVDLTPSYYHDTPAPAWFKLHAIDKADDSFVLSRTCLELPTATEECFTDLVGKEVKKLTDLRRQEVTLWVLQ